ncbi:DUF431-domain-containing protein [Gloeophyllum trabeum ATCC 11539]|uniref:DUF431-domain-containing protein n=1 Tax=Gloeophyllum trabeum (strain ATCC 11539 / FP-39264 / Madison 617) TaxID=670483 RepID=S7PTJ8_GLOTA|nr:DUF431-domain-containing protein [Gloeophyllum trabeum ATCC 11539]EPQ50758.1 DUF431-domain-containing protein [Gloeophyllum trabeum ATCC 11539]
MGFRYIVEHMEEDENTPRSLPEWVVLEYQHMRALAGASSTVHFTHLSQASTDSLTALFSASPQPSSSESGLAAAYAHTTPILPFLSSMQIPLERVCLLDPKAPQEISPADAAEFDCFLLGGMLGDDPPRDRTSELRALGFPSRHLGPVQMTTDTALGVTKKVVEDKIPLSEIPYVDFPTIRFSAKESVEMPFRYISQDGSPLLPPGMKDLLKRDLDRGFEF